MKEHSASTLLNHIATAKEMITIQTSLNAQNKNVAVSATSLVVGKNKVVFRLPHTYIYYSLKF